MSLLALLTDLAGVFLLFAAWRGRGRVLALAGWAVLIGAWLLWRKVSGGEFASVYVAIATALSAWALIFHHRQTKPLKAQAQPPRRPLAWTGARWRPGLIRLLVTGPLAALASLALGLLAASRGMADSADRLTLGAFVFLLAWVLLACWACAVVRLRRPALVLALITVICTGLVRLWGA